MKRDLNLIPKDNRPPVFTKYVLPVLVIVILYASTAYLALSIPSERLKTREQENAQLEQQIVELAHVEIEYQGIRSQLNELSSKKETVSQTISTNKSASNILSTIEMACPTDIVLSGLYLKPDGISIYGISPSDSVIAEFMVNLRANNVFAYTNISNVAPQTMTLEQMQQAQLEGNKDIDYRAFSLELSYSAKEILAENDKEVK